MRLIDADEIKYEVHEKLGLGIDYGINESDVSYVAYKHQIDSMPTIDPLKWIPVSERLPEDGKYVLAYSADDDYMTVEAKHKFEAFQITHWMPLPEPYKGEEDGIYGKIKEL